MGVKTRPSYNWIQAIEDRVIMRLQCNNCTCKLLLSYGDFHEWGLYWIEFISMAHTRWHHWKCGYTQLEAATINQIAYLGSVHPWARPSFFTLWVVMFVFLLLSITSIVLCIVLCLFVISSPGRFQCHLRAGRRQHDSSDRRHEKIEQSIQR